MKRGVGITILLAVVVPLSLWLMGKPVFSVLGFGRMSGLVGFCLVALTLVYNTRAHFLEKLVGDLGQLYRLHHLIGGVSLLLLLAHPLFLAGRYLHFWSDWPVTLGVLALAILISLLILTFFVNLPYQLWRLTHQFLGVAFLLAVAHLWRVGSDIAFNPVLRIYFLIFSALGLAAYVYRTLLGRWLVKRSLYQITKITSPAVNFWEVTLSPLGEKLHFLPGQFIFTTFEGIKREAHPFSLTSTPTDDDLKIVIKNLGDFTAQIGQLKKGNKCWIEGPFGRFGQTARPIRSQLWLAGGVGITPFLSLVHSLSKDSPPVTLYYVAKNMREAPFAQELLAHPRLKTHLWFSEQQGRFALRYLKEKLSDKEVFLCGPPAMVESLVDQLQQAGVDKKHIYWENFSL